jgi:hypothetical protein
MENESLPNANSGIDPDKEDLKSYFRREPPPETVARTVGSIRSALHQTDLEANKKGAPDPILKRDGKPIPDVGKLNGISGGGAFVLRNGAPRLAGTLIEYHQNRGELKCTKSLAIWSLAVKI